MSTPGNTVITQDGWELDSSSSADFNTPPEVVRETLKNDPVQPDGPPTHDDDAPPAAPAAPAVSGVEDGPTDDDADEKPEAPAEDAPKPKRKETSAERIARIRAEINAATRERHAEEARTQAAREARQREETALQQLRAPRDAAASPRPSAARADATLPPKPTWKAFEDEGKDWDEYQTALDQWQDQKIDGLRDQFKAEARQEAAERFAIQQRQAQADAEQRAYQQKIDRARQAHEDYDAVITTNLADTPQTPFMADAVKMHPHGGELLYQLGQHPEVMTALADLTAKGATNAMMDAVLSEEDPFPLLQYLAEHPTEFARFSGMPPRPALVALGKLAARLDGANNGSPSPPALSTSAPPPIQPLAGKRTSGAVKSLDDLDMNDEAQYAEYLRRMNEAERKRGRR